MTGTMNLWGNRPTGMPRAFIKQNESFLFFITADMAKPYLAKEGD
jgi:hypothetical protein